MSKNITSIKLRGEAQTIGNALLSTCLVYLLPYIFLVYYIHDRDSPSQPHLFLSHVFYISCNFVYLYLSSYLWKWKNKRKGLTEASLQTTLFFFSHCSMCRSTNLESWKLHILGFYSLFL